MALFVEHIIKVMTLSAITNTIEFEIKTITTPFFDFKVEYTIQKAMNHECPNKVLVHKEFAINLEDYLEDPDDDKLKLVIRELEKKKIKFDSFFKSFKNEKSNEYINNHCILIRILSEEYNIGAGLNTIRKRNFKILEQEVNVIMSFDQEKRKTLFDIFDYVKLKEEVPYLFYQMTKEKEYWKRIKSKTTMDIIPENIKNKNNIEENFICLFHKGNETLKSIDDQVEYNNSDMKVVIYIELNDFNLLKINAIVKTSSYFLSSTDRILEFLVKDYDPDKYEKIMEDTKNISCSFHVAYEDLRTTSNEIETNLLLFIDNIYNDSLLSFFFEISDSSQIQSKSEKKTTLITFKTREFYNQKTMERYKEDLKVKVVLKTDGIIFFIKKARDENHIQLFLHFFFTEFIVRPKGKGSIIDTIWRRYYF